MVKGIGHFGWALCVLFLLAPLGVSESAQRHHSTQSHPDDAPQIIIDQHQGLLIETNLNITGVYIDEELPIAMTWKIFSAQELIAEGDLISHLIETDDLHESSRDSWQFSLDLNFTSYTPCSCILEIEGTDTNNRIDVAQLMLFSQGANQEGQLAPSIILKLPSEQLTGEVDLEAIAMDDDGFVGVQWSISNSSEIAMSCIQTWIEIPESVSWYNLTPPIPHVNPTWSLDSTAYDDGVYSLIVRAVSEEGLYSPCACQSIGIDNHAPTAQIDGPSDLNEYSGSILFDGTASSDQFWGREELVFLWVLENELGEKTIDSGSDLRTFEVDASRSGNYTLTLTVADNAAFSDTVSHQFNITNQEPVATLRIGGQALADGDEITLVDDEQWLLECGDSIDSDNDKSGLICTWYVDGEPIMTGWERQLQKPDDTSTSHTLMLEVTDDDGAVDTIMVTFGIQGTSSDPMYNSDTEGGFGFLILMVITAVSLAFGTTMILIRNFSGHSASIPKWKRE